MPAFQAGNVSSILTTRIFCFFFHAHFKCFPGEMVDTLDLKSDAHKRNGSSPLGSKKCSLMLLARKRNMTRNESVRKWSRWKKFKNTEGREDMQMTSKSWRDSFVEKQAVKAFYHSFNETAMKTLWKARSGSVNKVIKNLQSSLTTFLVYNNFAESPFQAHQWITHKHVKVNDKIVKHPKFLLVPGDVIHLDFTPNPNNKNWLSRLNATGNTSTTSCQHDDESKNWVFDPKTNTIVYLGTDSSSPFTSTTWNRVKEFYVR